MLHNTNTNKVVKFNTVIIVCLSNVKKNIKKVLKEGLSRTTTTKLHNQLLNVYLKCGFMVNVTGSICVFSVIVKWKWAALIPLKDPVTRLPLTLSLCRCCPGLCLPLSAVLGSAELLPAAPHQEEGPLTGFTGLLCRDDEHRVSPRMVFICCFIKFKLLKWLHSEIFWIIFNTVLRIIWSQQ